MLLGELTRPVHQLPGVGRAKKENLVHLGIFTISDLLRHVPRAYEDRKTRRNLASVKQSGVVNTTITVIEHQTFYWRGRPTLKVIITDDTDTASLVCYGRNFLAKILIPDRSLRLFGQFQRRRGELQSSSFTIEPSDGPGEEFDRILPIYPLTTGISQRFLRRLIRTALDRFGDLEEEIPKRYLLRRRFAPLPGALPSLHFPDAPVDGETARASLAYGELFYLHLVMQRRARAVRTQRPVTRSTDNETIERFLRRLPFSLTPDQTRAFQEIRADILGTTQMMRLLQGDVGSGKTLVALLAAILVYTAGEQVAIMVPTELLARQQAETAARLLEPLGIRIGFLSGSIAEAPRKRLISAIREGNVDLVIGTHALFSNDVTFSKLGLVIVDEQHRFGVLQRLAIVEKGDNPDLLLMTATPIPRSLALTVFGDLETSTIRTMPTGRLPIRTHLARIGNEEKVYDLVRRELEAGRQAYFVYPLIEESEALRLKHAEGMYDELSKLFSGYRLALIHSRITEEEKLSRMEGFSEGKYDILVATTVVEVGVDVANATCIVIEHAERFGLAALHQLRGRVGRSNLQSYAFLVYDREITEDAKRRLMIMKETTDGFRIAEEDLKIRGPGQLTGIQQTGELELHFADLVSDFDKLSASREDVLDLLATDPGLLNPENACVREVLRRCPPFTDRTAQAG